jgi:hypothetical protein
MRIFIVADIEARSASIDASVLFQTDFQSKSCLRKRERGRRGSLEGGVDRSSSAIRMKQGKHHCGRLHPGIRGWALRRTISLWAPGADLVFLVASQRVGQRRVLWAPTFFG